MQKENNPVKTSVSVSPLGIKAGETIPAEPELTEKSGLLVFRHIDDEDWEASLKREREARLASLTFSK